MVWRSWIGVRQVDDMRVRASLPTEILRELSNDFAPPRLFAGQPNNLPVQLTDFIGRERELATVEELLARSRLVTLTGTGGVGKTRLALRAADAVLDDYPDGACFVDLAPLADEHLVAEAVLAALGLMEVAGQAPLHVVTDYLRARVALLVLDNCEHLLDGCARLADAMVHACPGVRILATSRELLGLPGEVAWRVPSLGLPPDDIPKQAAEVSGERTPSIAESACVRLFVDRIRLGQPDFVVTPAMQTRSRGSAAGSTESLSRSSWQRRESGR
jgi:predicted ATPase